METPRKLKKRWNPDEIKCLVGEITGNYRLCTNQANNAEKEAFYGEVTLKINRIGYNDRTFKDVMKKWSDFKHQLKKKNEKITLMIKAGETRGIPEFTEVEQKVLSILPQDCSAEEENEMLYGQEEEGEDEQYEEEEPEAKSSNMNVTNVKVQEEVLLYHHKTESTTSKAYEPYSQWPRTSPTPSKTQGNKPVSSDIRKVAPKRPGPKQALSTTKKPKNSPQKPDGTQSDTTAPDIGRSSSSANMPLTGSDQLIGGLTAIVDENNSLKKENGVLKRAKQGLRNENQGLKKENQDLKDNIQALKNQLQAIEHKNQALQNKVLNRENQELRNQALKSKLMKLNDDIQGIVANFD